MVSRLQRVGKPLDIEEQLTHPRSPLRSALIDSFLSPRAGPSTFILNQKDDKEKQMGLAQIRIRTGRPERDVVFMSPALETGNGSHAIWQRMLTHLCVQIAERGSLRVYARLPAASEELRVFKNVGFIEYSQADVYKLEPSVDRANQPDPLQLRPQHPGDGWGLQKLYTSITPRSVQNVEGLAQGQWDLARRRWGEPGHRKGYIWEVDGEILAALHIRAGKRGYWIRTMLHPNALEHSQALCQAALTLTTDKPDRPVYFACRQYESGWPHILPALGFKALTNQTLVVKPMTVRLREKMPVLMPALEASPTEGAASTTIMSQAKTTEPSPENGTKKQPHRTSLVSLL